MFNCIHPLILFLQKGQDSLCLSQAQTIVYLTVLNLKKAADKKTYFKKEEFNQMYLQATEQVLSLPPLTSLRREPFDFASFQNNTYAKFISAFEDELQKAFEQMHFWKCFSVFDPHGLPENINKITNYGMKSLKAWSITMAISSRACSKAIKSLKIQILMLRKLLLSGKASNTSCI